MALCSLMALFSTASRYEEPPKISVVAIAHILVVLPQKILGLFTLVVHILSHLGTLPAGLELWANIKRDERLLRDFVFVV